MTSLDTSGRAVLFAGIVVCIALLGMFALGVNFLYGLAIASSIGVLLTVVAALTLLPAMLGFLGPRVLSRRQRKKLQSGARLRTEGEGFWDRWARTVERHPAGWGTAAFLVVLLFALPFFSLRLGFSDQGNDPPSTTTRQAYDALARGIRAGLQRPAADRGAGGRPGDRGRPCSGWRRPSGPTRTWRR